MSRNVNSCYFKCILCWHIVILFFLCSHLQMIQFLNSLLTYLPASCSIHPVKSTRQQGAAQIFSLAVEKEVASLGQGVSLLLGEKEEEGENSRSHGHDEMPELGSVEGLQRCREAWQRDVDKGKMRLSQAVDVGSYRGLTKRMSEVQLNGDLAALLEIQRTFLS